MKLSTILSEFPKLKSRFFFPSFELLCFFLIQTFCFKFCFGNFLNLLIVICLQLTNWSLQTTVATTKSSITKNTFFSILHFSHLNFVVFVDVKPFSFRFLVVCRTDNSVDRSSVVSNRLPLSGNIHLQLFSFWFFDFLDWFLVLIFNETSLLACMIDGIYTEMVSLSRNWNAEYQKVSDSGLPFYGTYRVQQWTFGLKFFDKFSSFFFFCCRRKKTLKSHSIRILFIALGFLFVKARHWQIFQWNLPMQHWPMAKLSSLNII